MLSTLLRAVLLLACAAAAAPGGGSEVPGSRHTFYRSMDGAPGQAAGAGSRRVFGGETTELSTFPATCVLLDRYWGTRCSGSVLTGHWALTAAHCVTPHVAYVMYDSRRPKSSESKVTAVIYHYRHPNYKVLEEDEGRGVDVTQLRNDVGLLRTGDSMQPSVAPAVPPPTDAVSGLHVYNLKNLGDQEAQVLGFGRTERVSLGEELFVVRLRLVACERSTWQHCMCGVGQARAAGGARGVCSGDSGGPVVFGGLQVGVTSMGPMECAVGAADPPESATSVFTSLYQYSDLINATMHNTDTELRMRRMTWPSAGGRARPPRPALLALLAGAALLAHVAGDAAPAHSVTSLRL